jgi:hypothetical protein
MMMRTPSLFDVSPRFDGPAYDPALDHARLSKQLGRVFDAMQDGAWRTHLAATADRYSTRPAGHPRNLSRCLPPQDAAIGQHGKTHRLLVNEVEGEG